MGTLKLDKASVQGINSTNARMHRNAFPQLVRPFNESVLKAVNR
jgi:hypothetical protein